jgi:hypothetical protein
MKTWYKINVIGKPTLMCLAALVVLTGVLTGVGWAQDGPVPPAIDGLTQGQWVGSYGECAYILSAYNVPKPTCELPLLPGEQTCSPATCPEDFNLTCGAGNYTGGASLDIVDCRALDLNNDGQQDVFYDVYAGPYNVGPGRILENPDGSCSDVNGIWFSSPSPMKYSISGVPTGTYRMAVYMMSWDNDDRRQEVQVCIGGTWEIKRGRPYYIDILLIMS